MHATAAVTVGKRSFTSPVGIILLYHFLHNVILLFFVEVGNIDYTFMLSFATAKMQTAILSQNAVFLNYCALKPQRSNSEHSFYFRLFAFFPKTSQIDLIQS